MPKKVILLLFLDICLSILPICGQNVANFGQQNGLSLDWQEQILQQVDIEDLGDAAYGELLEELSDLTVWNDTTDIPLSEGRLKQNVIWSSNRCLNTREGFIDQSEQRKESNKAYLGDPWHHSLRYRMQKGKHFQSGLNLEKDAGEAWRHEIPGFDSWHAFLRAQNVQIGENVKCQNVVLGHYRLRMGCGLIVNQGFSLGKQYMSRQLLQQKSNAILPFASNAEYNYMQGVSADLRIKNHLTLLPYFSARQIDGTLSSKDILTAMQTDGFHRTYTEESHRHAAWELISGARLGWQGEWFDFGVHASYTQLQYDYIRNQLYYNTNYFRGHQLAQFSADYTVHALGGWLRGELAMDDNGAIANITAIQYKIGDDWNASMLYRYYGDKYRQLHASALRESSGMQGEQGLTLNLEGQVSRHWQIQAMLDGFLFDQPQYAIRDSASNGMETSFRAIYNHSKINVSLGYRFKHKGDYNRHTLDGLIAFQPTTSLTCKTQMRMRLYSESCNSSNNCDSNNSAGYAFAQSIAWKCDAINKCPFTLDAQACYFNTDDYDSRIYLTEKAILYGFGLPMLYGEGLRYSLTGTIKIGPHVNVDLKWAMTNYANRESISSGLMKISGNTQQDLWLQIRLKI